MKKLEKYMGTQAEIVLTIKDSLKFATLYQGLGIKPPAWQNVEQSFLMGISHLDISKFSRTLDIGEWEIFSDPLLENVFFTLAENVVLHGKTATEITLRYHESPAGLTLFFEDNGVGIPHDMKEKIFSRQYQQKKGMGLFLVRGDPLNHQHHDQGDRRNGQRCTVRDFRAEGCIPLENPVTGRIFLFPGCGSVVLIRARNLLKSPIKSPDQGIHIKPMQINLFHHLVRRSAVNRPNGLVTSVL